MWPTQALGLVLALGTQDPGTQGTDEQATAAAASGTADQAERERAAARAAAAERQRQLWAEVGKGAVPEGADEPPVPVRQGRSPYVPAKPWAPIVLADGQAANRKLIRGGAISLGLGSALVLGMCLPYSDFVICGIGGGLGGALVLSGSPTMGVGLARRRILRAAPVFDGVAFPRAIAYRRQLWTAGAATTGTGAGVLVVGLGFLSTTGPIAYDLHGPGLILATVGGSALGAGIITWSVAQFRRAHAARSLVWTGNGFKF